MKISRKCPHCKKEHEVIAKGKNMTNAMRAAEATLIEKIETCKCREKKKDE